MMNWGDGVQSANQMIEYQEGQGILLKFLLVHETLKFLFLIFVIKILMRTESGPVLIHLHDNDLTEDEGIV